MYRYSPCPGGRSVPPPSLLVSLRITAGLVLADEHVEAAAGHLRFDPPIAGGAPVIERKVATHHVGNEVGAAHRPADHRIGGMSSRDLK